MAGEEEEAQVSISSNSWWAPVRRDSHGGKASRQPSKDPSAAAKPNDNSQPNKITQNQSALTTLNHLNIITASIFFLFSFLGSVWLVGMNDEWDLFINEKNRALVARSDGRASVEGGLVEKEITG